MLRLTNPFLSFHRICIGSDVRMTGERDVAVLGSQFNLARASCNPV